MLISSLYCDLGLLKQLITNGLSPHIWHKHRANINTLHGEFHHIAVNLDIQKRNEETKLIR